MDAPSIAQTIEKYGTTAIAAAMGLPISTVHSWKRKNTLPGADKPHRGLYELRARAFWDAIKRLERDAQKSRDRANKIAHEAA